MIHQIHFIFRSVPYLLWYLNRNSRVLIFLRQFITFLRFIFAALLLNLSYSVLTYQNEYEISAQDVLNQNILNPYNIYIIF